MPFRPSRFKPKSTPKARSRVLFAEPLEERLLYSAVPVADIQAPASVGAGESVSITVTFDNASPTDTGFGPWLDVFIDRTGTDGAVDPANPNGLPTDKDGNPATNGDFYDGLSLTGNPSYLSPSNLLNFTVLTLDDTANGGLGILHPYAVDTLGNAIYISTTNITSAYFTTLSGSFTNGDQLLVIELPFGSFSPDQPEAEVTFNLTLSDHADIGVPLTLKALAGFRYGNDPLDNPASDPSIIGVPDTATSNVDVTLATLTKSYNGPENETATGPNHLKSYTLNFDVADGQTFTNVNLYDRLPQELQFTQILNVTQNGASITQGAGANQYQIIQTPSTTSTGGTLQIRFNSPTIGGTATSIEVEFYAPRVFDSNLNGSIDAGDSTVLAANSGADRLVDNQAYGYGTWIPIDPRDTGSTLGFNVTGAFNPSNPSGTVAPNAAPEHNDLEVSPLVIQKSYTTVADVGLGGPTPGDLLEFTLNFQLSDYYAVNGIVIDDLIRDGLRWDSTFVPTLLINGNTYVLGSSGWTAINYTVSQNFSGATASGPFTVSNSSTLTSNASFGDTVIQVNLARQIPVGQTFTLNGTTYRVGATTVGLNGGAGNITLDGSEPLVFAPSLLAASLTGTALRDGSTAVQFRVSNEMITRGQDGKLLGGGVNPFDTDATVANNLPVYNNDATTGRIVYRAFILDEFTDNYSSGESPLNPRDVLSNTVTISASILNLNTLAALNDTQASILPYAGPVTTTDDSGASITIAEDVVEKDIYAINGIFRLSNPANPNSAESAVFTNTFRTGGVLAGAINLNPGDEITYRLSYTIPTGDVEQLRVTDYFPLPIFDVTDPAQSGVSSWTFVNNLTSTGVAPVVVAAPAAGTITYGPSHTLHTVSDPFNPGTLGDIVGNPETPYVSGFDSGIDSTSNFLRIQWGDFASTANLPARLDLLLTVTVSNDAFADGLFLTNQVQSGEGNTQSPGTESVASAIIQIVLNQPEVSIYKGVVASTQGGSVGTVGGLAFDAIGSIGNDFSNILTGAANATAIGALNLTTGTLPDTGDLVRYALVVQNTGRSDAFDVRITDTVRGSYANNYADVDAFVTATDFRVFRGDGSGAALTRDTGSGGDYTLTWNNTTKTFEVELTDSYDEGNPADTKEGGLSRGRDTNLAGVPDVTNGSNAVIILYDLTVDTDAQISSTIINTATLTNYAGGEGAQDHTAQNPIDSATVIIASPTFLKTLTSTSVTETGNSALSQAVIGELVTYTLTITVPEGVTANARIVDTLDAGLAFVRVDSITLSSGLTSSNAANGVVTTVVPENDPNYLSGESTQNLTFNLGTLTNANTVNATPETITIVYTLVVLNTNTVPSSPGNQSGTNLNNSANLNYTASNDGGVPNATVRVATTINLTGFLANVITGVATTMDGVALALNDFVLVKDQGTPSQNGVYQVTTLGGTATLTRAAYFDSSAEITLGYAVRVSAGSVSAGLLFQQQTAGVVLNTSPIVWTVGSAPALPYVIASAAVANVTVIEPTLTIDKQASANNVTYTDTLTGVDGGDFVFYRIYITNASGNPTAFDLALSDAIPANLGSLAVISTSLTNAAGGAGGTIIVTDGGPDTLDTADFAFTGNNLALAGGRNIDLGGNSRLEIVVRGTLDYSVVPNQSINNTATVTWTSLDGTPGQRSIHNPASTERTGAGGPGADGTVLNNYSASDATATTILSPINTKSIVITSEDFTTLVGGTERVAIGEIIRYRLIIQITEGSSPNLQIVDNLPVGLVFINDSTATVGFVSAGNNISSTTLSGVGLDLGGAVIQPSFLLPDTAVSTSSTINTDNYNSGTDVRFKLGDIANSASSNGTAEFIVIEFNALVLNTANTGNQNNTLLSNNFNSRINGDTTVGSNSNNTDVRVAEPNLTVSKTASTTGPVDAGDTFTYVVTISNNSNTAFANNAAPAFDIRVLDILDAITASNPGVELELVSPPTGTGVVGVGYTGNDVATTVPVGTTVLANASNSAGIDLTFNRLNAGSSIALTLTVRVISGALAGAEIENLVRVSYTSLPGASGTEDATIAASYGTTDVDLNPGTDSVLANADANNGTVNLGANAGERTGGDVLNPTNNSSPSDSTIRNNYAVAASAPVGLTVAIPTIDKTFKDGTLTDDDSSVSSSTGGSVVIGEQVTYDILITLPEGVTQNVQVEDLLPEGLSIDSFTVITDNSASLAPVSFDGTLTLTPVSSILNGPGTLAIAFGNITTNVGAVAANANRFVIRVNATVTNIATNQQNITRTNTARLVFLDPDGAGNAGPPANRTLTDSTPANDPIVTIVEPTLAAVKSVTQTGASDAGAILDYSIVISNSSGQTAYDVTLSDAIDADIDVLAGFLGTIANSNVALAGGATASANAFEIVDLGGGNFALRTASGADVDIPDGGSITLTYRGIVAPDIVVGTSVENVANVRWTSTNGINTDERGGNDVIDNAPTSINQTSTGAPLNNYAISSAVTISVINNISANKTLVTTSLNGIDGVVTPGEVATYRITIILPEGVAPDLRIRDAIPAGMAYISGSLVLDTTGFVGSVTAPAVTPQTGVTYTNGQDILFDFSSITVTDNNITTDNTFSFTYQAVVLDVVSNDGILPGQSTLTNTATHNNGGTDPTFSFNAGSASVTVVEPDLNVINNISITGPNDAGAPFTYTITINPTANSTSDSYELSVSDILPAELGSLSISSAVIFDGLTNTNVAANFTIIGNTLSTVTPINLFLNTNGSSDQVLTITITGTLSSSINPGETVNTSTAIAYTGYPGDRTAAGGFNPNADVTTDRERSYTDSDTESFIAPLASLTKSLFSTSDLSTSGSSVAIGETVTYALLITLPEGTTPDLAVVDQLPAGLQYLSSSTVTTSAASGGLLTADFNGTLPAPVTTGGASNGDDVTFTFGSISVNGDNLTNNNSFLILITARVLNVIENQSGATRDNAANFDISGDGQGVFTTPAVRVTVVEPRVTIAKSVTSTGPYDAGDLVTYQVTINNLAVNGATSIAYDVALTDLIPTGLLITNIVSTTLNTGSATALENSAAAITGGGTGLSGTYDIPIGGIVVVTYQATLQTSVTPLLSLNNDADARFSSQDGVVIGERTGINVGNPTNNAAPLDNNILNNYAVGATANVTTTGYNPLVNKQIVSTSEASTSFTSVNGDVLIGEVVRYQIKVELYEGTLNQFVILDNLPTGMQFLPGNVVISTLGVDTTVSGLSTGTFDATTSTLIGSSLTTDADTYTNGTDIFFKLGDLINSDNDAGLEFVLIQFDALVLNTTANQASNDLLNTFQILRDTDNNLGTNPIVINTLRIDANDDGTAESTAQSFSNTVTVNIVEPNLTVALTSQTVNGDNTAPYVSTDAGDTVTYVFTVTNNAPTIFGAANATTAFDINFRSELDRWLPANVTADLTLVSAVASVTATDNSAGDIADLTVSSLAAGSSFTITITATIKNSAPSGALVANSATVTYTSLPGTNGTAGAAPGAAGTTTGERTGGGYTTTVNGANTPTNNNPPATNAAADTSANNYAVGANTGLVVNPVGGGNFILNTPSITKAITATSETATTGVNVAIGETVTYTLTVTIPEGETRTVSLIDGLPPGLAFVTGSTVVDFTGSGVTSFAAPTPVVTGTVAVGQSLAWTIGTITNPAGAGTDTFTLTYTVRVADIASNIKSVDRVNSASLTYVDPDGANNSGTPSSETVNTPTDPSVNIVEPFLTVTKAISDSTPDIGDVVTYTVTIVNTTNMDGATAFDVRVSDAIPTGLTLDLTAANILIDGVAINLSPLVNVGSNLSTASLLDFTLASLANGSSVTITYLATVNNTLLNIGTTQDNNVRITYDSLEGDEASVPSGIPDGNSRYPDTDLTPDRNYGPVNTPEAPTPSPDDPAQDTVRLVVNTASISGFVYHDADNNGIFVGSEADLGAGISIRLTGTTDTALPVDITVVTDANGFYQFTNLAQGTYILTQVNQPAGYLDGKETAGTLFGGTVDNNQVNQTITNIVVPDQSVANALNYNFGELLAASISGKVYRDYDNDGVVDGGEPNLSGVVVELTGINDFGVITAITLNTDGSGNYDFTNLRPGTYTVTETQPVGYNDGRETAGSTGGTVNNTTDNQTITTIPVTGAGGAPSNSTGNNFGELDPVSVSGTVYHDLDNDGVRDVGESGIFNVTITLTGLDDRGVTVNLSTTTASDGTYSFTNLRPSNGTGYTITQTQPAGFTDGIDTLGSGFTPATGNSNGSAANDVFSAITIANVNPANNTGVNYNFGELFAPTLAKSVAGSNLASTSGSDLAIGEVVRYRIVTSLPQATIIGVQLRDNLPAGMRFLDNGTATVAFVSDSTGNISSTTLSGVGLNVAGDNSTISAITPTFLLPDDAISANATSDVDTYTDGTDIFFKLGNITSVEADADLEYVIIEFDAIVTNNAVNNAGSVLNNDFTVRYDTSGDGTPDDVTTSTVTPVTIVEPSLSLLKVTTTPGTDAGDSVVYTLTITNAASATTGTAYDINILDLLDGDIELINTNVGAGATFGISITGAGVIANTSTNGNLNITLDSLAANSSATITLRAMVRAGADAGATVSNAANLTYTSTPGVNPDERDGDGPAPDDYTASAISVNFVLATPLIDKLTPADTTYAIGEIVTYDILVTLPEGETVGLVITDNLPAGLVYTGFEIVTAAASSGGLLGADFNGTVAPAPTEGNPSGNIRTFTFGTTTTTDDNLGLNNSFLLRVTARVDNIPGNQGLNSIPTVVTGAATTFSNTATLQYTDGTNGPSTVTDPTAPGPITVVEPVLTFNKAALTATTGLDAGDTIQFSITFTNTGTSTAHDVLLNDLLPSGLLISSIDSTVLGGGATTDTAAAGVGMGSLAGEYTVPVGGSVVVTYTVTLQNSVTPGTNYANSATLTWSSINGVDNNERTGTDPNIQNNGSLNDYRLTDAVTASTATTFTIDKTVDKPTATIGEVLTYSVTLTLNEGTTQGVVVTDTLPVVSNILQLEFVSGSASISYGTTASSISGSSTPIISGAQNQTLSFTLGNVVIPADAAANTITLTYQVVVRNVVTNQNGDFEINAVAGSGTNVTTVIDSTTVTVTEPRLTIDKSASPTTGLNAGDTVTYTIVLDNLAVNGATSTAFDVTLSDLIPSGLLITGITSTTPAGGATGSGTTAITGGGTGLSGEYDIPVNGSVTIIYTATVQNTFLPGQSLTNDANATYSSLDGTVGGERNGSGIVDPEDNTPPNINTPVNNYAVGDETTITGAPYIPLVTKSLVSTSESGSTGTNGLIGEIVRYQLKFELFEGTLNDFVIQDFLPDELLFLNDGTASFTTLGNTNLVTGATLLARDSLNGNGTTFGNGTDVFFQLGDVVNNDNDLDVEYGIIEFNVLVLNTTANQNAATRDNNFALFYDADNNSSTAPTQVNTLRVDADDNGTPELSGQSVSNTVTITITEPALTFTQAIPVGSGYDAGDEFTITYTITNNGTAPAYNIRLADLTLPAEFDLTAISFNTTGTGGSVTNSTNTTTDSIDAELSQMAVGSTWTITATVTLRDTVNPSDVYTNPADVSFTSLPGANGTGSNTPGAAGSATGERTGADGVGGALNDYALADTESLSIPNPFIVTKVADRSTATIGGVVTYTVEVTVIEGTTANIVLNDTLPAGMSFVAGSATITSAAGMTINGFNTNSLDQLLSSVVNPGANEASANTAIATGTFIYTYQALVTNVSGNQSGTTLVNDLDGSATGVSPDNDNAATVTVVEPVVTATKSVDDNTPHLGQTITYTITLTNTGNATAFDTVFTDTIPAGLTGVAITGTTLNAGATEQTAAVMNGTGTNLTGAYDIPVGGSVVITYTARVSTDTAIIGGTFDGNDEIKTNTVSVTYSSLDGNPSEARDGTDGVGGSLDDYAITTSTPITVVGADLSVTKTDAGATATAGGTVVYTITVTNNGTDTANSVVVTDLLPTSGTTFTSASATASYTENTSTPGRVIWNLTDPLVAGASVTFTVTLTVNNPVPTGLEIITNNVTVTYDEIISGEDPTDDDNTVNNNQDSEPTPISSAPILVITKTDGLTSAVPGDPITYTITVRNTGDQNALVDINDLFPTDQLTFIGAASFTDSAGVLHAALTPADLSGSNLSWTSVALYAGDTLTLTLTATVTNPQTQFYTQFTNSVTVSDTNNEAPDATATDTDALPAFPDLVVVKTNSTSRIGINDTFTYTIVLSNIGDQNATNVVVTDTLPPFVVFVGASGGGVYNDTFRTITWTTAQDSALAVLDGQNLETITYTVTVNLPLNSLIFGTLTNTVTVNDDGTNGLEPDYTNNTSSVTTQVLGFLYDKFQNFSRPEGEDDWDWYHIDSVEPYALPLLPVTPMYSGEAEPGSTLVLDIFNAKGEKVGSQTVMVDTGGNWLATFPSTVLKDYPQSVVITQTAAPYADPEAYGFNLRTYFSPAINSSHFFFEQFDIGSVFSKRADNVINSLYKGALNPIHFGNDAKYDYETLSAQGTPSGY